MEDSSEQDKNKAAEHGQLTKRKAPASQDQPKEDGTKHQKREDKAKSKRIDRNQQINTSEDKQQPSQNIRKSSRISSSNDPLFPDNRKKYKEKTDTVNSINKKSIRRQQNKD